MQAAEAVTVTVSRAPVQAAGPTSGNEPSVVAPRFLGRYEIIDEVGKGGMGRVYRAYDPKLDREVALKLLRRVNQDQDARARLMREAQAMAKLSHPNVLPVYDVASDGFRLFLAMELVRGQSLRTWLEASPRSWAEVLAVLVDVGRGLAAAHAVGLVHRDLKPGNVLIGDDGRVRVLDFGLARGTTSESDAGEGLRRSDPAHEPPAPMHADLLDDSWPPMGPLRSGDTHERLGSLGSDLTQAGTVVGTPAYMAPEQHLGRTADHRSDQYGFCVTLWEALYGRRPFKAEELDDWYRVKTTTRPQLDWGRSVPRWLHAVVLRGLASRPSDRYASMDELLQALTRARRRRLHVALTIGGALAVLGGAAAVLHEVERHEAELQDAAALHDAGPYEAVERQDAALDDADARLPRPRATDPQHVQAEAPPPADPVLAAAVEALEGELAGLETLLDAGRAASVHANIRAVVDRAQALGHAPLEARARFQLASVEEALGRYEAARDELEQAYFGAQREGLDGLQAEAAIELMHVLGGRMGQPDEGERWERFARVAVQRVQDPAIEAAYLHGAGMLERGRGQHGTAITQLERSLQLLEEEVGPEDLALAAPLSGLGALAREQGDVDAAGAYLERALRIVEATRGPRHPLVAGILVERALVHGAVGEHEQALRLHRQALELRRALLGPRHPETAASLAELGESLLVAGRRKAAIKPLERAVEILAEHDDRAAAHEAAQKLLERARTRSRSR